MLLDRIDDPQDLKQLEQSQLPQLAQEIREVLLTKLSAHGGHVGPNLGVVELSIALHRVFDSPHDRIVFDVSHQSYTHKILTGRKRAFMDPAYYDEDSGFTNPEESEHDWFNIGHTSTGVSLASGLATARDRAGERYNVIAIVGDGSLSGGEAFEGLDYAGQLGSNFIVIVNDNDMSIAPNHGGLYGNLAQLRSTKGQASTNVFTALGFEYHYVEQGNDIDALIEALSSVKNTDHPVLLHVRTEKGRGFDLATADKETWHWHGPFDRATGKSASSGGNGESYESLTARWLLERMQQDPSLVAITAGTPTVMGFGPGERERAGAQFIDVGIAEEHAVALASGIARNGGRPVFGVSATFLQRAYDQIMQDLCINGNPAVMLVFGASVYGMSDVTHLCLFDMPMLSNIPQLVYLAPTCREEYEAMLQWATTQREHPVAIRVPARGLVSSGVEDTTDYGVLNRYEMTRRGRDVAILAVGDFYPLGEQVADALHEQGVEATVIKPKFISGLDEDMLDGLLAEHRVVLTLEDGMIEGGFGQKVAAHFGPVGMRVATYGIDKSFPDRYKAEELLQEHGVTVEHMAQDALRLLELSR